MKNTILTLLSIMLMGCATIQQDTISLDCSRLDNEIRDCKFWDKMTARMIEIETDNPAMQINDFCFIDSMAYILTMGNGIISVNTQTGEKIKEVKRTGNAKNEMIYPTCINVDESFLYVYDPAKSQIQVLDRDLNFIKNIPVTGHFNSFIKCGNGFLCEETRNGTKALLFDNEGKQKFEQTISCVKEGPLNIHSGFNSFVKNRLGHIYVKGAYSDSIYVLDDKGLNLKYDINLGGSYPNKTTDELNNIDNSAALGFFVFDTYLLFSTQTNVIQYHLFDFKNSKHYYGVQTRINDVPFFPKYQNGNRLANVVFKEQVKRDKDDPKLEYKLAILIYDYKK